MTISWFCFYIFYDVCLTSEIKYSLLYECLLITNWAAKLYRGGLEFCARSVLRTLHKTAACNPLFKIYFSQPNRLKQRSSGIISTNFLLPQNDVQLVKEGDKVGASEATLLNMLNISPFTYGLVVQQVYDQGTVFSPRVLDITDEDLIKSFQDVSFFMYSVVLMAKNKLSWLRCFLQKIF